METIVIIIYIIKLWNINCNESWTQQSTCSRCIYSRVDSHSDKNLFRSLAIIGRIKHDFVIFSSYKWGIESGHYTRRHIGHCTGRHIGHYTGRHIGHYTGRHIEHYTGHYTGRHVGRKLPRP